MPQDGRLGLDLFDRIYGTLPWKLAKVDLFLTCTHLSSAYTVPAVHLEPCDFILWPGWSLFER